MRTEGTKVLGETRCKRPKGKKGKGANGGYGDVGKAVDKSMRKKWEEVGRWRGRGSDKKIRGYG